MAVIILSGVIGAGKSALTGILADELGTEPFYENVAENPVLPLFYKDPKKYAFLLQVFFLNTRYSSIKKALVNDNNVLDRSIYEDSLFFQMNADMGRATKEEVDTYYELLDSMLKSLDAIPKKTPDLLIHIKVSYPTMIKRIKKRGRTYEQPSEDPSLKEYYEKLLDYYEKWYASYDKSPKMLINGDKYDFVGSEQDRAEVLAQIKDRLKDLNKI